MFPNFSPGRRLQVPGHVLQWTCDSWLLFDVIHLFVCFLLFITGLGCEVLFKHDSMH